VKISINYVKSANSLFNILPYTAVSVVWYPHLNWGFITMAC